MSSKTLYSSLLSGATLLCLLNGHVFAGQTTRVSVSSKGGQAETGFGSTSWSGDEVFSMLSANGRYVAFKSTADNLVTGDTNNLAIGFQNKNWDIFVHDRVSHKTERVNISSTGEQAKNQNFGGGQSIQGNRAMLAADR